MAEHAWVPGEPQQWEKVEHVLGDRLERLGLEVRWTDTTHNYSFCRDEHGRQLAYLEGTERSGPRVPGWFHTLLEHAGIAYPTLMTGSAEPWLRMVVAHQHALGAALRLGGVPALFGLYAELQWPYIPLGVQRG